MSQPATIAEAARLLKVSPDTVRRHIRIGLLPAEQKPRGRGYQWIVTLPDDVAGLPPAEPAEGGRQQRHGDIVEELRRAFAIVSAELEARREEVRRLLALVEQAHARP